MATPDLNELAMTVSTDLADPTPYSDDGESFYDLSTETRESGDGDSGIEYKEKPSPPNSDIETLVLVPPPLLLPSAPLRTQAKKSRIPVRTMQCTTSCSTTSSSSISGNCRTNVNQSNQAVMISDPADESAVFRTTARAHRQLLRTAMPEEHQTIILEAPEQFRSLTGSDNKRTIIDDDVDGSDTSGESRLEFDSGGTVGAEVSEASERDSHDNEQPDTDGNTYIKSNDAVYQRREKSRNNGTNTEGAVQVVPEGLAAEDVALAPSTITPISVLMCSVPQEGDSAHCDDGKLLLSSVSVLRDSLKDNYQPRIKSADVSEVTEEARAVEAAALPLMDSDLCDASRTRGDLIQERANNNVINADRIVNTTKTQQQKQQPLLGVVSLLRQVEVDLAQQKHYVASCANNKINDLIDNVQSTALTPCIIEEEINKMSVSNEVTFNKEINMFGNNSNKNLDEIEREKSPVTNLNNNSENSISICVNLPTDACERSRCESNKSDSKCLVETDVIACETSAIAVNTKSTEANNTIHNSSECVLMEQINNNDFIKSRNIMGLYVIHEECENKMAIENALNISDTCENIKNHFCMDVADGRNGRDYNTPVALLMNADSLLSGNTDNSNYKSVPLNHNELEFTNNICSDGYDNPSLGAQNDNLIDSISMDNCTITKELLYEHKSSCSSNQLEGSILDEATIVEGIAIDNCVDIHSNANSNNNFDDSLWYCSNGAVGGGASTAVRSSDKVESDPFKDSRDVAVANVADDSSDIAGTIDREATDGHGLHDERRSSSTVESSSAGELPSLSVAASIHVGAVECAAPPPSGCSSGGGNDSRRFTDAWTSRRCNAADVPVQDDHTTDSNCWTRAGQPVRTPRVLSPPQCFAFRNGRLVFDPVVQFPKGDNSCGEVPGILDLIHKCAATIHNTQQQVTDSNVTQSSGNNTSLLSSKHLNKRPTDGRLKELGEKLKKAGLTDDNNRQQLKYIKYSSDKNQNFLPNGLSDYPSADEYDDSASVNTSCCEFDVNRISAYSGVLGDDGHFFEVYDELEDEGTRDLSLVPASATTSSSTTSTTMPATAGEMDTIDRSKQHNPDHENLKSLLRKPGRTKDNANRTKKGVVFNEKKNEFFDADYIILIREDCDYDEEEDDGVCTCNQQHEMVRLTCCEPNCNCGYSEGGPTATPQSPKFAPPLEFVDAVTLSPPEGYKDLGLEEQQMIALQQLARRGQLSATCGTAICRECSATHEIEDGECSEEEASDNETAERMDHSQQTTPTTPPAEDDEELTCDHFDHHTNDQQHHLTSSTSSMTVTTTTASLSASASHVSNNGNQQQQPVGGSACGSPISGILKGGRLWKQQSSADILASGVVGSGPAQGNGAVATVNGSSMGVGGVAAAKAAAAATQSDSSITSDDEAGGSNGRRSVRFIDASDTFISSHRESCDGAASETRPLKDSDDSNDASLMDSAATTELMLTFKLPNHMQISNNSLKPNSAMRQLFPCTKVDDGSSPYLVTAEALRAFDEAKRSKLQQILQESNNTSSSSSDTDSIKRAIERNTLRRSLIKYEPKQKKHQQKTDNSLVERIKQLTCDIDEEVSDPLSDAVDGEAIQQQGTRSSPPGEEARVSPEANSLMVKIGAALDKSFSPSSSSTASSNSSVSSTYKKITDLFGKTKEKPDIQNNIIEASKPPDLCNSQQNAEFIEQAAHYAAFAKANSTNEARKQFLSTLAPLTACVGGIAASEDYYYHLKNQTAGERVSIASSVGTEYSLEDIDEGLKKADEDETKRIAPDVLVGTPSASDSADELAIFVQQDASRIERIKKKYQPGADDEDEHDDYGFNRRPSVRGIKPRFGSTTEILQQIQNQMQPPSSVQQPTVQVQQAQTVTAGGTPPRQPGAATAASAWPYYSETTCTSAPSSVDGGNKNRNNVNHGAPVSNNYSQQPQYITTDDVSKRNYAHFRPTNVIDENMYQNCANQRCTQQQVNYRPNVNIYAPTIKIGGDYYHQTTVSVPASAIVPPRRNSSPCGGGGRPQSPPPQDITKKNHYQTMMYIPYNHIDAYQQQQAPHSPNFYNVDGYNRITNQNQINKSRYIDPATAAAAAAVYQMRLDEPHYATKAGVTLQQQQAAHRTLVVGRSESPLPVQYSTARATQTAGTASTTMTTSNMQQQHCTQQALIDYTRAGYYTTNRYHHRPISGSVSSISSDPTYVSKVNRHSFPTSAIPPQTPPISLADLQQQQLVNGYIYSIGSKDTSIPNSPTKQQAHRFIERGVPEGAASVSPQDSIASASQTASTMTSPITSPHQHLPPTLSQTAADLAALKNTSHNGAPIPGAKPLFYAMNV